MKNFEKFLKDESGATAIEYGLLAALISVAAVGAFGVAGTALEDVFDKVGTKLDVSST